MLQDLVFVGNQFDQGRDDAEYLQQLSQAQVPLMNPEASLGSPRCSEEADTLAPLFLGTGPLPIGHCECGWKSEAQDDKNKKKSLNKHLRDKHAEHLCPQQGCKSGSSTARGLQQHMARAHQI